MKKFLKQNLVDKKDLDNSMDKEESYMSNRIEKSLKNWKNQKDMDQLEIQMARVRNSKSVQDKVRDKIKQV